MTAQDLTLPPAFDPAVRERRLARSALRQTDWLLLAGLVVLSTVLAALFYRFTLLVAVDGTAGVLASLTLSVCVHGALVLRTLARHRSRRRA